MDTPFLLLLLLVLSGGLLAVAVVGFIQDWPLPGFARAEPESETLDGRLARLQTLADEMQELSAEVRDEAAAQIEAARSAASDAARQQELAALSKEAAAAVAETITIESDRGQRASKKTTIVWALIGVAGSGVLSAVITWIASGAAG